MSAKSSDDGSTETGIPLVFVNLIGGQDELVFDGNSFVMDARGGVTMRAPAFTEGLYAVDLEVAAGGGVTPLPGSIVPLQGEEESVYGALVQGTRDYVNKHRFPGVVLGLSGGVDSALTLCIAVDALGADRVHSVSMPSRYTSQMSKDDAALQASWLKVKHSEISIEGMFEATLLALQDEFAGRPAGYGRGEHSVALPRRASHGHLEQDRTDAAHHRQQERNGGGLCDFVRRHGRRLRAHQGLQQALGLPTGCLAQCTVAGIPARVIERPPSAELRPDQKDTDSLPPYEVLDPILEAFIEEDLSVDQIAARGFDRATVGRILDLVRRNEYKRRQAPPGVRVSGRAFGRDWRYPITNGYRSP